MNHEQRAQHLLDLLLANENEAFNDALALYLNEVKESRIQDLQSKEIKVFSTAKDLKKLKVAKSKVVSSVKKN